MGDTSAKTVTYENITLSEEVAVRLAMRCTAIGCDVDDYIEQALTYAMDNEEEKTSEAD